jgi:hypothetical protein
VRRQIDPIAAAPTPRDDAHHRAVPSERGTVRRRDALPSVGVPADEAQLAEETGAEDSLPRAVRDAPRLLTPPRSGRHRQAKLAQPVRGRCAGLRRLARRPQRAAPGPWSCCARAGSPVAAAARSRTRAARRQRPRAPCVAAARSAPAVCSQPPSARAALLLAAVVPDPGVLAWRSSVACQSPRAVATRDPSWERDSPRRV